MDSHVPDIAYANHFALTARASYHPHRLLFILDTAALVLLSIICFYARDLGHEPSTVGKYGLAVVVALIAYCVYAFTNDLYDWRMFRGHLKVPVATYQAITFTFGVLLLIGFAFKLMGGFSRLWLGSWFLGICVYVLISRLVLAFYFNQAKQTGYPCRKAVILGGGEHGWDVLDHILRFDDQGIQVIGFLDDRISRLPDSYRGFPILGRTEMAEHLVRAHGVDLVIVALPWSAHERVGELVRKLSTWAVDIYMAPGKLGLELADRPTFRVAGMQVLGLKDRPISEWCSVVKRSEDLCLAIPAIILLSPLMLLVALAIKLESKGDVFFVQERYGFRNELIRVHKFRSMYTDRADRHAETLTSKDDPRVTQVGRFIRRTSLDELPQLFNVLLGSMSVVGPRPHATRAKAGDRLYDEVVDDYASRHRVKPGITGWAQCNGWRGETDTEEKIQKRVEHDLYYIENWSVFLDLFVMAKTFMMLLKKDENAY